MSAFDDLGEGVRKIFLAGVGAVAMSAEKSQQLVNDLVKKGELTVEEGKALNEELRHHASKVGSDASDAILRAKLKSMTTEERAAWLANAQSIADDIDAAPAKVPVEDGSASTKTEE